LFAPVKPDRYVLLAPDHYGGLTDKEFDSRESELAVFIDSVTNAKQAVAELRCQLDRATAAWIKLLDDAHSANVLD
jgi:hypothetical protein